MAELDEIKNALHQTVRRLPAIIATEAVNFSKDRFREQNWVDTHTEPWKPRKRSLSFGRGRGVRLEKPGRAILVKSGKLKRSVRKIYISEKEIIIGSDVAYAKAHNDGFRGAVKQRVKAHTRKNGVEVKDFDRVVYQNIPRRRFMGKSAVMIQKLERTAAAEINRTIKQFLK